MKTSHVTNGVLEFCLNSGALHLSEKTVTYHMWCSGILELITVISLSGTKCFYHFHSEKMFHNHRRACLQRCFIAVNILIANTSCGRSVQRLSVCILIINQMFGLWQKNHIIYMYTLSLQYFLINFILTWNWRWPGTVGEKCPPKRKKNI